MRGRIAALRGVDDGLRELLDAIREARTREVHARDVIHRKWLVVLDRLWSALQRFSTESVYRSKVGPELHNK